MVGSTEHELCQRALVVIPTYQEAENIAEVLRRLHAAAPAIDVLVVDDDSPDGTADIARAASKTNDRIDVLVRYGQRGFASAYQAGFAEGIRRGYEVLVQMDSDLSHDPAALPSLLAALNRGADLVVGSRYVAGGSIPNWPIHRRLLSRYGNRYAVAMLGMGQLNDVTSGFRAYSKDMLSRVDPAMFVSNGYGFQIELAYAIHRQGGRIVEVPIEFVDRVKGTSKMSSRVIVEALWRVTWWGTRARIADRRGLRTKDPV